MPEFTADGQGVYSFPSGNVTYDGVSLGSTATYRASGGYLVNGVRMLERRCKDNIWTALELIISNESELESTTPQCTNSTTESGLAEDHQTVIVVVGFVCSLVFLTIGVLLGVVGLYLIQRVRGRLSGPTSSSPPPLPPPVTYEEVGVAREVKSSQDIQLTSNEAYGPIHKDNIPTSRNTAYGQVQL